MSGVEWPGITTHAADRFHERKRPCEPPVGPRVAWIEGESVSDPQDVDADAVRYHHDTGLVLVLKDGVLVTCIAIANASPGLYQSVAECGGVPA